MSDPLPVEVRVLWDIFRELSGTRQPSMGITPITFIELRAWCDLYGTSLTNWELETVMAMDSKMIGVLSEKRAKT